MGHLMRIVAALVGVTLLVGSCAASPTTTPSDPTAAETTAAQTTRAAPTPTETPRPEKSKVVETPAGSGLVEAQDYYMDLSNGIQEAYDPFYELMELGSQDINALQYYAAGVADSMRIFTTGLASYDWPAPVQQVTVDAVVKSYRHDAASWDNISSASTIRDMESLLFAIDASVDEADRLTNSLRTQLGLPST